MNINLNKKLIAFLVIVLSITSVWNCKKSEECTDCGSLESQIPIQIDLNKSRTDFKYYKSKKYPISYAYTINSNKQYYGDLINYLKIETPEDNEVVSLNLYYDSDLSNNIDIDLGKIKGVLMYYLKDKKLFSKFWEKKIDIFRSDEVFSCKTNYLTSNDAAKIGLLKFPETKNISIISIINSKQLPKPLKGFGQLQINIRNYKIAPNNSLRRVKNNNGDEIKDCYFPCKDHQDEARCIPQENQGGEDWTCWSNNIDDYYRCHKENTDETQTRNALVDAAENDDLRKFKKEFLFLCPKGITYAYNYYHLSKAIPKSSIDVEYANLATMTLENDIMPLIKKIQDSPESNDILFNDDIASNIITLLNSAKSKLSEPENIQIINDLISDVNFYKNKTVKDVREHFTQ